MNQQRCGPSAITGLVAALALAALVMLAAGCQLVGWGATVLGGGEKNVHVAAQYTGLAGKTVAVVVNADSQTLYSFPNAPADICRTLSTRLVTDLPQAKVVDPKAMIKFQTDNPYWNTLPFSELAQKLGVQRVLYVDLADYSTHEPGNSYEWRGVVAARVGVIEAGAKPADRFVYATNVRVQYPEDKPMGVLNSDDKTMQMGMLALFSRDVSRLFVDHQEIEK